MKHLIFIILFIISILGFTLLNNDEVKSTQNNKDIALNIRYYDNARLYRVDIKTNKFYLIGDFKKKRLV